MKLKFTANSLCAAEQNSGLKLADIINEIDSEGGARLTTLRALVAAGLAGQRYGDKFPVAFLPDIEAGMLIDKNGIEFCSVAVGVALKQYFTRGAE